MAVDLQPVDLEQHRAVLARLLRENLSEHGGEPHLEWLYLDNPCGRARVWMARERPSGDPIGIAAAFPRHVYIDGEKRTCWNLGDFAIRRDYRSLGPAVSLQRACLADVMEGKVAFAYDHPHSAMTPVYRRLKIPDTGSVVRYTKLLRVDDKLRGTGGAAAIGKGAARAGNLVLRVLDLRRPRSRGSAEISSEVAFDERFDALDKRFGRRFRVVGCRDAAYLRWRYLDNPTEDYDIVTAVEGDALKAYAVFRCDETRCRIDDLCGDPDSAVEDALFGHIVGRMRRKGVMRITLPTLAGGPLTPALERWGFRPREAACFVVSTAEGTPWDGVVNDAANWFLTNGDRDV